MRRLKSDRVALAYQRQTSEHISTVSKGYSPDELAHSVTLCLSAVGAVSMSPQWVEPLIAASIAYVGLSNLLSKNVSTRWPLTFCFGLIHGLGFAGALRDIGLPADGIVFPLALFNAGIELGQLLALAAVVPLFHWVRRRTRFGVPAARALNGALVAAGIFWCAVRLVPAVRAATDSEKPAAKTMTSAPTMTNVPSPAPAAALDEEPPSHRSVYPSTSEPAPADVERLCRTFHELPRTRRAECGATTPGFVLTRECVRTLGAAVRSSAVRVAQTELDHCLDGASEGAIDDPEHVGGIELHFAVAGVRVWLRAEIGAVGFAADVRTEDRVRVQLATNDCQRCDERAATQDPDDVGSHRFVVPVAGSASIDFSDSRDVKAHECWMRGTRSTTILERSRATSGLRPRRRARRESRHPEAVDVARAHEADHLRAG